MEDDRQLDEYLLCQGGRMDEPGDRQPGGTAVTGRTGILTPAAGSNQLRVADQEGGDHRSGLHYALCP